MSNASANVPDISPLEQTEGRDEVETETTGGVEEDEPEPELPLGVIFEVLKNERRRRVIRYLQEADGEVTLGEVSEHIAALENDKEVSQITYAERKRVYVGLYQCHLPKMDDMGIVDFNRSRGLIELTENAASLSPYMEERGETVPWYQYYGALSGVGIGASLLLVVGSVPVSSTLVLGLVVLGFTCLSCAHAYTEESGGFDALLAAVTP